LKNKVLYTYSTLQPIYYQESSSEGCYDNNNDNNDNNKKKPFKWWESCRKEGQGTPERLEAPGETGTKPGRENKTQLCPQGQGTAVKPYINTC